MTSDNPEETYDALKKYGTDLVERARQNKLDPVIGRDEEIRNVIRILSRKLITNQMASIIKILPIHNIIFYRMPSRWFDLSYLSSLFTRH